MNEHAHTTAAGPGLPRLAHELNNILMIIAGYADVILEEHPDDAIADDVQEIRRAVKRAVRLTSEFASSGGRVGAASL